MRGKDSGTAKRIAKELIGTITADSSFKRASNFDISPLTERVEELEYSLEKAYTLLKALLVTEALSLILLFWALT
tara:strand:- start:1177 stop:1401 length:225 start_codon:yes stop_codon:yes gene_type:complete